MLESRRNGLDAQGWVRRRELFESALQAPLVTAADMQRSTKDHCLLHACGSAQLLAERGEVVSRMLQVNRCSESTISAAVPWASSLPLEMYASLWQRSASSM